MRLDGQVAIITGAGRGIGRAIALAYAKEGARLALAARSADELEDTAREVRALGAPAYVIPTDVSDREQVDRMVAHAIDRYSTIDILVNNAGIVGPVGALQDNDPDHWLQAIQVNVIGTFLCCRAALPVMVKQDRGRIINLSGSGGMEASAHISAYCARKAAVVRLTEGLALELAQTNVRVNVMGPGGIQTRMAEEIQEASAAAGLTEVYKMSLRTGDSIDRAADLAVFLASSDSGSLSGRLVSAKDDFFNLPERVPEIMGSEVYQLRRVEIP